MFRYPPDFSLTLRPGHALYDQLNEYVPVVDPASVGQRLRTTDPVFVENAETTVVGDVGLFDDDSEAEEDHVLLLDEVPVNEDDVAAEEGLFASSDEDSEALVVRRTRRDRRRYCLEGCDCERDRGRLCECEKRGDGMCTDECQCKANLCRATPKEDAELEEKERSEEEED